MSTTQDGTPSRQVAPVAREDCPFAVAAELLGQRWVMLILRELFYGVDRFDAICADLDISRSTLSGRLQLLATHGLVTVAPYEVEGERTRTRYHLTEAGRDFTTALWAITQWSERHLLGRPAPARLIESSTGAPVEAALCGREHGPIGRADARWEIDPGYERPA